MTKDSLEIEDINGKTLGFSDFWQSIASGLGNSRLIVDTQAESIKYFLDAESDHATLLRGVIQQSYKRCHCYHLKARFDVNVALDVLGETSHNLHGTKEDDLIDIELLEEIAWLINQYYRPLIEMPTSMLSQVSQAFVNERQQSPEQKPKATGSVVSMANIKIMQQNRRL